MGLFGNKNKYDIKISSEEIKYLVTKLSKDTIKINAKLIVPDGYSFLIGKKGKVTDIFESGEHYFSYSNLPEMCRKFHIDKIVDGKRYDKFNANLYVVDCSLRKCDFKSYRKVEMGTKAYGFFSVGIQGTYTFKVNNARELMQSLLNEFDYIKTGEAEGIIGSWIDEIVVNELEKQNFIISDIVSNSPKITECIRAKITKLFTVAGLELVDVKITKYNLPKKYQAESDRVIASQNSVAEERLGQENQDKELSLETNDNQSEEQKVKNQDQDEQNEDYDYVPFGNFKITKGEKPQDIHEAKPQKNFVDLSLDSLYNTTAKKTKRCLNCGTENDEGADHCIICGEHLD